MTNYLECDEYKIMLDIVHNLIKRNITKTEITNRYYISSLTNYDNNIERT